MRQHFNCCQGFTPWVPVELIGRRSLLFFWPVVLCPAGMSNTELDAWSSMSCTTALFCFCVYHLVNRTHMHVRFVSLGPL